MSRLIFLILLALYLNASNLSINLIKDDNITYSILHLRDTNLIKCYQTDDDHFKEIVICQLQNRISKREAPIEDRYFKVNFEDNLVEIRPKYHFLLYSYDENFTSSKIVKTSTKDLSKHWVVVGYRDESKLFKKRSEEGINFPIEFHSFKLPIIGELDFDKKPLINPKKGQKILRIKNLYKEKKYERVIQSVETFLRDEESDSPFISEASLYKLMAIDKILNVAKESDSDIDPYEFIDMCNAWIDQNPSNAKLPLVYEFLAKTYLKLGRGKDAQKYLDILDQEYKDSRYNYETKIYQADILSTKSKLSQAKSLYKSVLFSTKDYDLASEAALKLSKLYLSQKRLQKAKLFTKKVLEANPKFINKSQPLAFALAKAFVKNSEANLSLEIISHFGEEIEVDKDELDKSRAYWHELNGDIKAAIEGYRKYLKRWQEGKYREFVSLHLNKLLLGLDESNETKRLNYIETLLKEYGNNSDLKKKAILEKAKILFKQGKYEEVLDLRADLSSKEGKELVRKSALKLFVNSLKRKECQKALRLKDEHNITTPKNQNEDIFVCYKETHRYRSALKIAKEMSRSDDIKERQRWYYEEVKLLSRLTKDKALLLVANDLEKLLSLSPNRKYQDIIFDKIEAFYRLKAYDDLMLREISKAQKLFPNDPRLLDALNRALEYAKRIQDTNMIEIYAKKMVDLQKRLKIDPYSPKLEIDLVEALRQNGKYKEALKVDLSLLYKKLSDDQRAHVLYLAGYLSEKLNRKKEAKDFYLKCGEIVEDSAWVGLCSENAQLLDE